MIFYDWAKNTVIITSEDLIKLLRTGHLIGTGSEDETVQEIKVED